MKQNFKTIAALVKTATAKLENLHDKTIHIKSEGRTPEWQRQQISMEIEKTKGELKALAHGRKKDLDYQRELASKLVEPSHEYAKRTYHLNKAAALANNMNGEDIVKMYKYILTDSEGQQFKSEYESIFLPRLGVNHLMEFDVIRREHMTEDEHRQEKYNRMIDTVEKHLDTIGGLEEGALDDIATGRYNPRSDDVQHSKFFDAMLENAEQVAEGQSEPSQESIDIQDNQ